MNDMVKYMNCLQACIYSICKKRNIDDFLIFCCGWFFTFDADKLLSQSLSIQLEDYNYIYFERFYGITSDVFLFDENPDVTDRLQYLETKIRQSDDVLLRVSSHDCPWHKGFMKINIPHYVKLKNILYEKEVIVCEDPFFNLCDAYLPFTNFFNGCESFRIFQKKYSCKPVECEEILSRLSNVNIGLLTKNIISFSNKLLCAQKKVDLFDYVEDIYCCNNVRALKFIADSRYGLCYSFEKLSKLSKTNKIPLLEIANQFNMISSLYLKINNYYMKLFYRDYDLHVKINNMRDKLLRIVEIENEIYLKLKLIRNVTVK